MKNKIISSVILLAAASICDAGEEQIKLKSALSSFHERYSVAPNHKAFAQSAEGAWAWSSEKPVAQDAIDEAMAKCTNNLKSYQGPCLAINVDDEWIPVAQLEKKRLAFYHDKQMLAERVGILTLTDKNIKKTIEESKGRLAVQFSSYDSGCGYCTFSNGPFEMLVSGYVGTVKFARITWQPWTKMNGETLSYYNISGVPTLIVFNDGKEELRISGWTASREKETRDKLDACCKR